MCSVFQSCLWPLKLFFGLISKFHINTIVVSPTSWKDSYLKKTNARSQLVFLGFCGFAVVYAMRVNLSVAIVAMVEENSKTQQFAQKSLNQDDVCPIPAVNKNKNENEAMPGMKFNWDEVLQGKVLGSFFYGYALTNLLGGRLAEKFGGRRVFGTGIVLTGILTVLSPFAAYYSTNAFILIRVLEGMTEGVTFPAINVLVSKWIPPSERSRSTTRILGGSQFGTVITLGLSGIMCESAWGWPSVFYVFGSLGIIWGYFWFKYIYESPEEHPSISTEEKNYVVQSLSENKYGKSNIVPWSSIFTSVPFFAVVIAHLGSNWGFYVLLTELPTYLKNIQHFNLKDNGFISALPYLIMWLFSIFYSNQIDKLLEHKRISLRCARSFSTALAQITPMVLLLLISGVGCNSSLVVALLCISIGITSSGLSGFICAFQELAPNYAGTLTGISNTIATFPGFLAPVVTGKIINNEQTISNWKKVFTLTSIVYFIACCFYTYFMSVEIQPWNRTNLKSKKQSNKLASISLLDA